jgi:hypothetical protein
VQATSPAELLITLINFLALGAFAVYCALTALTDSAAKKREKALPRAVAGAVIFLICALIQSRGDWRVLWVVLPISLVVWLNIRNTYYCEKCNSASYNHGWIRPLRFCPRCGAELRRPAAKDGVE